jgi:hypothetical protein
MWTSRAGWLDELANWLDTGQGRAACTRVHVRSTLVLLVATVLADHADHASGRHCAVTNRAAAALAGCGERTVTTVRGLLAEAQLATEVRRGTGSAAAPSVGNRPSIWHLMSRPQPVDNPAVCDLPPSRRDRRLTHVRKNSPSGCTQPPRRSSPKAPWRRRSAPRPLHTQKLAADVIARSIGLDTTPPGNICDALTRSGLDLDGWTAPQIIAALNADMQSTSWSWPDLIARPGAFLATRLRRLPAHPTTQAVSGEHMVSEAAQNDDHTPASAAARAAAIAYLQQHRRRPRAD